MKLKINAETKVPDRGLLNKQVKIIRSTGHFNDYRGRQAPKMQHRAMKIRRRRGEVEGRLRREPQILRL